MLNMNKKIKVLGYIKSISVAHTNNNFPQGGLTMCLNISQLTPTVLQKKTCCKSNTF